MSTTPSRLAAALALSILCTARSSADDAIRRSVVKIFTISQAPDFYQPWQNANEQNSSGSGVVIAGNRILTNAHVVSDQIYVTVRRSGEEKKYDAVVEFVAHDSDLATLKVKDPDFFKGMTAIQIGDLPGARDKVAIYGFPTGGDELSVTEGTISRVEVISYAHSGTLLLALQTDAAINPGNSGGPMIRDGRLAGIAFQSLSGNGVENIGYGVPSPLIKRFLKDISDGHYDGIPEPGIAWQPLASPRLREYYKMPEGTSGVRIAQAIYGCSGWDQFRTNDVLTAVDGVKIFNDATYPFDRDKRLLFTHLTSLHQTGETESFDILRDGRPLRLDLKMRACDSRLVKGPLYDVRPKYFIYGGLVFTVVTSNWLGSWPLAEQPIAFRYLNDYLMTTKERQEAVVLSYVLPHKINEGYQDIGASLVESVNGRKISRLSDLVEAFAHPQGGFQFIRFDPDSNGSVLALDAAMSDAAGPEILAAHRIPKDRSDDLH